MFDENDYSSDVVQPACRFFREIISDSERTDHDIALASEHTRDCVKCKDAIGQMIHERIQETVQEDASGT